MSATNTAATGSAGETSTRPMAHVGHAAHADTTSRATATNATASTAGVTRQDAQPVHCQPHPLASTIGRSLRINAVSNLCAPEGSLLAGRPADRTRQAKTRKRLEEVKRPGGWRTS